MGQWTPVAYYSVREFASEAEAVAAARDTVCPGSRMFSTPGPDRWSAEDTSPKAGQGRSVRSTPT
jgi:hypothetical protein